MNIIQLQREADAMERCFDSIEKGECPRDEDLLIFHWKGVRWLDCINQWNGIDTLLTIDRKHYYPIRAIKECLIINGSQEGMVFTEQRKIKTRVPRKKPSKGEGGKVH